MINGQTVYAIIFARGGSKGVPGKNIKFLNNKPLIAHSIESAKRNKYIDKVFVSTDDKEIAEIAKRHGAEVPFLRPSNLAQDDSPEWLSWQHAVNFLEKEQDPFDIFVTLPTTSPLRNDIDVCNCIEKFDQNKPDMVITAKEAERSPWFNMVKVNEEGFSIRVIEPSGNFFRRQDAPEVFDMTTVAYVSTPGFIKSNNSIFEGKIQHVLIPKERAIDIDTEQDFRFAEFLINEGIK